LSRPESKFTPAGAALDAAELLAAFEAQLAGARGDRRDAIARLLSAAPDWREARDLLRGAFGRTREDDVNQRVSEYLQRPCLKTNGIDND
jgi:hypothetical protein